MTRRPALRTALGRPVSVLQQKTPAPRVSDGVHSHPVITHPAQTATGLGMVLRLNP